MAGTPTACSSYRQHNHASATATEYTALPLTLALPHRPQAVSGARHLTRAAMIAQDFAEDLEDTVLLVVSELVTNAIAHASPPLVLHLDQPTDDTLRIAVDDGGATPHPNGWHASCTEDEHGRGISLIAALAEQHGAIQRPGGHTTHWATVNMQT
ncbi:ATP-binding protein [Streptomyces chartreusis]|uniref:ATP-binding protein n=1 Tax=Streptomyces chartreusis TaxID=1969 RepID=UPI0033CDC749